MSTAANHPMAWADQGSCHGHPIEIFYPLNVPTKGAWPEAVMAPARAICNACPTFAACHTWAVE